MYKVVEINQNDQQKYRNTWKFAVEECKRIKSNVPVIFVVSDLLNFLVGESWVPLLKHTFNVTSLALEHDKQMAWLSVLLHTEAKPSWEHIFEWTLHTRFVDIAAILIGADENAGALNGDGLLFSAYKRTPHLKIIHEKMRTEGMFAAAGNIPPLGSNLRGWASQGVLLINCIPCKIHHITVKPFNSLPEWGTVLVPLLSNVMMYYDKPLKVCIIGSQADRMFSKWLHEIKVRHKRERGAKVEYKVILEKTGEGNQFCAKKAFANICGADIDWNKQSL